MDATLVQVALCQLPARASAPAELHAQNALKEMKTSLCLSQKGGQQNIGNSNSDSSNNSKETLSA